MSFSGPREVTELAPEDYDVLDDGEFADFLRWDARRTDGGPYHLGDYCWHEVFARLRWLKCYCIRLRGRLAESKNAKRLSDLEKENARLAVRLANQCARLDRFDHLREENAALRRLLNYHRKLRRGP